MGLHPLLCLLLEYLSSLGWGLWFIIAVRVTFHLQPITVLFTASVERGCLGWRSKGRALLTQACQAILVENILGFGDGRPAGAEGWCTEGARQAKGSHWGSYGDSFHPSQGGA